MRTIEITAIFYDKKGATVKDTLSTVVDDNASESEVMTWATDLATEWFYSIAEDECAILWSELGGGTDYEYEQFFENYIQSCNLDWTYKKRYAK